MKLMRFVILALLSAGLTGVAQTAGRSMPESTPVTPGPVSMNRPQPNGPRPFNPAGLVGMVSLANRNYVVMFDGPAGVVPDRIRLLAVTGGGVEIPLTNPVAGSYVSEQPFWVPGTEWGCKSVSLSLVKAQATLSFGPMLKTQRARCSFGSKSVELMLLDANESGTLGESTVVSVGEDGFAARSKRTPGDVAFIGGEAYPLGIPFVALGAVWKLSSGADGKVVAERQPVAPGALVWRGSPPQDVKLTLAGKDLLLTAQKPQADGSWLLPAGDYRVEQCQYAFNGMQVNIDASAKPDAMKLTVVAGKPQAIGPLPEIVGKVTSAVQDGAVRFDLSLSSAAGARIKLAGGPKPQLRVLAANGQEVYRGNFEYG